MTITTDYAATAATGTHAGDEWDLHITVTRAATSTLRAATDETDECNSGDGCTDTCKSACAGSGC